MNAAVADTSLFIANESGRALDWERVPERVFVSIVTFAELRAGVLAADAPAVRARRLATLESVQRLQPLPIDERVAEAWAILRLALRDAGVRLKSNDAWIAATALSLGVPLLTQDGDFDGVPGLAVVRV